MSRRRKNKKQSNPTVPDSIPIEFLERVSLVVSESKREKVLESFHAPKFAGFRWNPLIESENNLALDELKEQLGQVYSIDWFDQSHYVKDDQREVLVNCEATQKSQIYIQNPSSFLPCLALAPQPGESVLDLCASPGGKTLLLAALMKNEGLISAVEPIRNRYFKLQSNLKRYGCSIAKTYLTDGRSVGRKVPNRFDRVLIDAPCSGETRIHQLNPDSFQFWSERKVREQSRKQYGLIRSGFEALRPGGLLVYCTCSFAPEENEKIVSDFLNDQPHAELEKVELADSVCTEPGIAEWKGKKMHNEIGRTVRIIPDQLMNGFFIASIRKNTETQAECTE